MSIIIVSGFGRCGSSMVMQMLHAGGVQTTGEWPAFEDAAGSMRGPFLTGNTTEASTFNGKAVKVLDPQVGRFPRGFDYRVIWCSRDYSEQAKSQVKFLRMVIGVPAGRAEERRFERSYRADKPKAIESLRATGCDILEVRFEDALRRPADIAREIATYCELPDDTAPRMAAAVRSRSPACAPGLEMEISLLASGPPSSE